MNNYIYIAVMAAVSYAIRVLPLTLIRKPVYSVLFILCTVCHTGSHDLPSYHPRHPDPHLRTGSTHRRNRRRMARCRTVPGICDLLCAGVCD